MLEDRRSFCRHPHAALTCGDHLWRLLEIHLSTCGLVQRRYSRQPFHPAEAPEINVHDNLKHRILADLGILQLRKVVADGDSFRPIIRYTVGIVFMPFAIDVERDHLGVVVQMYNLLVDLLLGFSLYLVDQIGCHCILVDGVAKEVEASATAVSLSLGLLPAVVPCPHFLQAVTLLHEGIFICFFVVYFATGF